MAVQMAAPIVWGGTSPSGHPRNSLFRQLFNKMCSMVIKLGRKNYLHSSRTSFKPVFLVLWAKNAVYAVRITKVRLIHDIGLKMGHL